MSRTLMEKKPNIIEYKKIDILFFERPLVDLRKFAFKIAKNIKDLNANVSLGAVCIEIPEDEEQTFIDYFYHRDQIKNIDEFLIKSGVKEIIFTNSRIPDLEFILHAKKLGIKTIMIQEGVMFDGMNINDFSVSNLFAVLGYLGKTLSYFNIIRNMCKYDHQSYTSVIGKIIKIKKNITIIVANSFSEHLICDYILTMGEYWEEYYTKKIGYKKEQIRLIGDHDLDGFAEHETKEPAICYIANVLVEDGTVRKSDFSDFLNIFAGVIDKKQKLYIKLHPRSDISLYEDVFKQHNVTYIRMGTLPAVTTYIGHRSALLGRALYESDNLIIWRFANEEVCFYEQWATAVCTTKEEFETAVKSIDIGMASNEKKEDIKRVYWNNPRGSLVYAAELIIRYSKHEVI